MGGWEAQLGGWAPRTWIRWLGSPISHYKPFMPFARTMVINHLPFLSHGLQPFGRCVFFNPILRIYDEP